MLKHMTEKGKIMKTKKKNRVFEDLVQGLEEIKEYQKGQNVQKLKTHIINRINVKQIREKLKLSQTEFADAYRIPLSSLRNWEQGRRMPDATTFAYLISIMYYPKEVRKAQETFEKNELIQA